MQGKLCLKHPELNGLRNNSNQCSKCKTEASRRFKLKHMGEEPIPISAPVLENKVKLRDLKLSDKEAYNAKQRAYSAKSKAQRRLKNHTQYDQLQRKYRLSRSTAEEQQTPVWASPFALEVYYSYAWIQRLTVDHIIPLRGTFASGLHIHTNLELLPHSENYTKGNKFEPCESLVDPKLLEDPHPVYIAYWKSKR